MTSIPLIDSVSISTTEGSDGAGIGLGRRWTQEISQELIKQLA